MNHGLERYVAYMESISTEVPDGLESVVTSDIRFRDPFNNFSGISAFEKLISDMCDSLDRLNIVVSHAGEIPARRSGTVIGIMRWDLSGRLNRLSGRAWQVSGYSELTFADDLRVSQHVDYWDAASGLYEQLPLFGSLCRWVRRRLALQL